MLQIRSFLTAFVILVVFAAQTQAQPQKITMKVGEKKQITLKNVADDAKILNPSDDVFVSRAFDDPKLVAMWIIPSKPGTIYTGVASTKDGKTLVDDLLVIVEDDNKPIPPKPPKPDEIVAGRYGERLLAPYMVNPDATALQSLIDHLTKVNQTKYNTKEEAVLELRKHSIMTLKGVRDEVSKIIGEINFTGDNFQSTLTDVIAGLKYTQGKAK